MALTCCDNRQTTLDDAWALLTLALSLALREIVSSAKQPAQPRRVSASAKQSDLPSLTNTPSPGGGNRPPGDRAPRGQGPVELGSTGRPPRQLDRLCLQL